MAKLIDGKKRKIARPTVGRMRRIQALDLNNANIDTVIEATRICIEGDLDGIDWEEIELPAMQEVIADFLQPINPTAALRFKQLTGLNPPTTATGN